MELKDVRKKAKELQLTVKTHTLSTCIEATVYDTLSTWNTKGNVFNGNDPQAVHFLFRLGLLTDYLSYRDVCRDGVKVLGLK